MKLISRLIQFIKRLFTADTKQFTPARLNSFSEVLYVSPRDARNDLLTPGTMMIVKDGDFLKWVRFICPCGCGDIQVISLQESHSPHWRLIEEDKGVVTLQPSVHVSDSNGCGAHFFIRRNRIDWV